MAVTAFALAACGGGLPQDIGPDSTAAPPLSELTARQRAYMGCVDKGDMLPNAHERGDPRSIETDEALRQRFHIAVNFVNEGVPKRRTFSFYKDSRLLDSSHVAALQDMAEDSRDDLYTGFLVRGHADKDGNAVYNMQISYDRAADAADILAEAGIARSRICVVPEGEFFNRRQVTVSTYKILGL